MINPWFFWSMGVLAIWIIIFAFFREERKEMLFVSLWTMPFGLTEPFFVPEYWNPPSLFNLAAKTGFDIESLIFTFALGGIAAVLYELFFKTKHKIISKKIIRRHKWHLVGLILTFASFFLLYFFTNLNPIYSGIISLLIGAFLTLLCRPDLKMKMIYSGFLFLAIYFMYFLLLNLFYHDWVQDIWNLNSISGILLFGIPVEELVFAFSFGLMWSSFYEHFKWYKIISSKFDGQRVYHRFIK